MMAAAAQIDRRIADADASPGREIIVGVTRLAEREWSIEARLTPTALVTWRGDAADIATADGQRAAPNQLRLTFRSGPGGSAGAVTLTLLSIRPIAGRVVVRMPVTP